MDEKTGHKVWIIILVVFSILGWGLYLNTIVNPESYDPDAEIDYWSSLYRRCEANYASLSNEIDCVTQWGDPSQPDKCMTYQQLIDDRAMIASAYRESQRNLGVAENDLIVCMHNQKYYKNALDNVSPYCSEGLDQLVIDGLRAELDACKNQNGLLQHELADALNDRRICKEELLGAPCHSHYDGLHCTWETCERPDGRRNNFKECLLWTGDGLIGDGDVGYCSGASWFWDTENPGWGYDNYLYCKSKPTCTTWSD